MHVLTVIHLFLSVLSTARSDQTHISRSARPQLIKPIAVLRTRSLTAAWTTQSTGPYAALPYLEATIIAQTKRPEAVVSCLHYHARPQYLTTARAWLLQLPRLI